MGGPLIGITCDLDDRGYRVSPVYGALIREAGGVPVLLPCEAACAAEYVRRCDGVVLSGGDDPVMEHWEVPTHPQAKPIHPQRQAFELALLRALDQGAERPVLGICLGMQLMGLHAGGGLDQYLAGTLPTAGQHWPRADHEIAGVLGTGVVHSHHRQALTDPGSLSVVARAADGVIEAVRNEGRPFYLGVQWHPERTGDERLGAGLFRELVAASLT
ncbi:MAG: gamma-glutamyl-gamma-aminobutyrate hydrolase family protein [Planctomycetota bacterium]|jgi:putative glutamine amidotransferase